MMETYQSTCVKPNSNIQDIDSITGVVQHLPDEHISHLEFIETSPKETNSKVTKMISICYSRHMSLPQRCVSKSNNTNRNLLLRGSLTVCISGSYVNVSSLPDN